jgi:TfoX/Sxy family transcriptional regulator of competence genes
MDPQERFDEIVDDVLARHGDVERAQMMGMPSLKRNGKLVAGLWKGTMAFKLPDSAEREEALALEGAALFDPGERGRPFKEWVAVPAAQADSWPELAEKALRG